MRPQPSFTSSYDSARINNLYISKQEGKVLRELAKKVCELASRPEEKDKRELWYKHNDLEKTRPLVFCDPENGWNEIITDTQLKCHSALAQEWEMRLRKEVFWGEQMCDDRVVRSDFDIPYYAMESSWGLEEIKTGGENGGAYTWQAPLKDYSDMGKLHYPHIQVDHNKTKIMLDTALDLFGDLLDVHVRGIWWWSLGLTWTLVNLRGLEQVMYDLYDYPDELHNLMAFLRDGTMSKIDFLEAEGLLSLNNDGIYVGSGGFGWTRQLPSESFKGKVRTQDMWGFGESQETSSISVAMFNEFIFPYQLPLLSRFGLNSYGCCEALNNRWETIKQIPNLRRVSVSPWADIQDMADKLGNEYIFSYKPHPAYLALPQLDSKFIREDLRKVLKATSDCNVEIIMKDNNTIGKNPQNVIEWCRIAKDIANSQ